MATAHPSIKYLPGILVVLCALSIDFSLSDDERQQEGISQLLLRAGFTLTSRIRIIRQNSTIIDQELILKESYSNTQKRARLDLKVVIRGENDSKKIDTNKKSSFYHDGSRMVKTVSEFDWTPVCEPVESDALVNELFGEMASVDKHLSGEGWMGHREDAPDYMIGLSRLLVLVDTNRNKLKRAKPDNQVLIRNQETIRYRLDVNFGHEDSSQLIIYYARSKGQDENSIPLDHLPIEINVAFPNNADIMIDFSQVNFISDHLMIGEGATKFDKVDLFTLPLGVGCSEKLPRTKLLNGSSTGSSALSPMVMSYRAEKFNTYIPRISAVEKIFVAYDGYQRTLRTDVIRTKGLTLVRDLLGGFRNEDEYLITIHDLRKDLKHNIKQRISVRSEDDEIKVDRQNSQCATARISPICQVVRPFEPLLPFDSLVSMGRSIVRGVETEVFEHVTQTLPPQLFPPVDYIDLNQSDRCDYEPDDKDNYTITYFFMKQQQQQQQSYSAHQGKTTRLEVNGALLGPLMRIDVFLGGKPFVKFNIFEFSWQLADAPNGDTDCELFTLHDKCSERKIGKITDITMELTNRDDAQVDNTGLSIYKIFDLMKSPVSRNQALVRGIAGSYKFIGGTQLYDISSRAHIFPNKNTVKLSLDAKLEDQRRGIKFYEAKGIGLGFLQWPVKYTLATDFNQCFWRAAHKRSHHEAVLFTLCKGFCLIDENPKIVHTNNTPTYSSDQFSITQEPSMPCLILRVDEQEDRSKFADDDLIYNSLNGKILRLPFIGHDGQSIVTNELAFEVKNLELKRDNLLVLPGQLQSSATTDQQQQNILSGLSLTEKNAQQITKPPDDWTSSSDTGTFDVSIELCHSQCMTNMSCHSYSICVTGQGIKCFVSELDFRNIDLSAKMRNQGRNQDSIVSFDIDGQDESDDQDSQLKEEVKSKQRAEFKVDKRCKTYNKWALEMFKRTGKARTRLEGRSVQAVEDEEECADLCLKKNVRFFKRLSRGKFSALSENELAISDPAKQEQIASLLKENMRFWCSSFRYLSLVTSTMSDEVINSIVGGQSKFKDKKGLCLMGKPDWMSRKPYAKAPRLPMIAYKFTNQTTKIPQIIMDSFEFVYSSLYSREYQLRLLPSSTSREVNLDEMSPDDVRRYIHDENYQVAHVYEDAEACARACFSQTVGLKPWCKSFEYIEDRSSGLAFKGERVHLRKYCVFNSMSVAEARQTNRTRQLITNTEIPDDMIVWHYEPKISYTLDDLLLARLRGQLYIAHNEPWGKFTFGVLGISAVLVLSLASAICLTIGLNAFVSNLLDNVGDESTRTTSMEPARSKRFVAQFSRTKPTNSSRRDLILSDYNDHQSPVTLTM